MASEYGVLFCHDDPSLSRIMFVKVSDQPPPLWSRRGNREANLSSNSSVNALKVSMPITQEQLPMDRFGLAELC